ncbi:MAG: tetratricopeptide repeat protein [Deltaproteobacteria bacterium]|nr:MAG: tetratricopeptide repeat protein [Deltaproteobacteria bacterium]
MRSLLFATTAMLATGCAAHTSVEVLHPAQVMVPGHVQTIAIIDRSSPDNVGGNVLGAIEGALTGEGIMADREGRQAAINDLSWALREGDRYEIIVPNVTAQGVDSGVFDTQLSWSKAKRICERHGCDAILALEAFDSDSDVLNLNDGNPLRYTDDNIPVYGARRQTRVMTSWRLYDTSQKAVLDEQRDRSYSRNYDEEGSTLSAARNGLPLANDTVRTLGGEAGKAYAGRISPTWRWESRTWFAKGSPSLKMAKRHVKAGDWEGAAELWRQARDSGSAKERGKASFNLALYNERKGNLRQSLKLAKEGAVAVPKARTRSYVAVLQRRVRDQERLEQQLREAEEGRLAKEAEEAEARSKAGSTTGGKGQPTKPASGSTKGGSTSGGGGTKGGSTSGGGDGRTGGGGTIGGGGTKGGSTKPK